jgi:heme-degrading monooxygenase HmoA
MQARVNTFQGSPDGVEKALKNVREQVLPNLRQVPGWAGLVSLVDRSTGKTLGITLWESEDALRQSEQAANSIRQQSADAGGAQIVSVERYEVTDFVLAEQAAPIV